MVQNDPQYTLVRSPTSSPVFMVCNAPPLGSLPSIYGKMRLGTCVQAINRSSEGYVLSLVLHTDRKFWRLQS